MKLVTKLSLLFLFAATLSVAQTKWNFDASHTDIGFEVDHMVISSVDGEFEKFDGTVVTNGENFESTDISFTVDVASINTNNEQRDNHLRSDDFFNAEKYPKMTFESKSMEKVGDNKYKLVGDLTIRDVTKEVVLEVDYQGMVTDPWGNTRVGFKVEGTINRFDFNLKWNKLLETGGLVVGEDVTISLDVELIKATQS